MFHTQSVDHLPITSKKYSDDCLEHQLKSLLTTCHCSHVGGKDYELEVASFVVNGLLGENETADVYLYAAIERKDWDEVSRIYHVVFRPSIVHVANSALSNIKILK